MTNFLLRPEDVVDPPPQPLRAAPPLLQGYVSTGEPLIASTQDGSLSANNIVRAFSNGVPIVGGILNELNAMTNATLAPAVQPFLPKEYRDLPEEKWEDRYRHALAIQEGMDEAFEQEHPYVSAGLNVAGGVAGTAPVVLMAPAAFGVRTGGGLVADAIVGATTNGSIGAADAAVRSGGDPEATLNGAKWGAVGGAVGPVVGPTIGKVLGPVDRYLGGRELLDKAARIAGVKRDVFSPFVRAVRDDGLDPTLIEKRFDELGPRAVFADLGENLREQAAAIAAMPGRARQIVRSALAERQAGATGRINAVVDENFGKVPVRSELNEAEREAFDRGQTVLDTERPAPSPSELAIEFQEAALPKGTQIGPSVLPLRLSQGATAEIKRIIGTNGDDLAKLSEVIGGKGEWNRARLTTLFGKERADRVLRVLETEGVLAKTAGRAMEGSTEGAKAAARRELGEAEPWIWQSTKKASEALADGNALGVVKPFASGGIDGIAKALLAKSGERTREGLAGLLMDRPRENLIKALTSLSQTPPPVVDPIARALISSSGRVAAMRNGP